MADWDNKWQESQSGSDAGYNQNATSRTYHQSSSNRGNRGRGSNNSNWRQNSGGNGEGRSFRRPESDGNGKVIVVPSSKVGRIIGKGGAKIKDIEFKTEAKVKIGDSSGPETAVTLFGSDEAISKANEIIQKLVEDYKPYYKQE